MHQPSRRQAIKMIGGATALTVAGTGVAVAHGPVKVEFPDQDANGASVNVASVTLPHGGWIVLHEQENGKPGTVIGHSGDLDAGTHMDVNVAIQRGKVPNDQRRQNRTLIAMAHKDTGEDGEFEFPEADPPYVRNGSPVTDSADITF